MNPLQRSLGSVFVLLWSSGYLAAAVATRADAPVRPDRVALPPRRAAAGRDRRRDAGAVAARATGVARPRRHRRAAAGPAVRRGLRRRGPRRARGPGGARAVPGACAGRGGVRPGVGRAAGPHGLVGLGPRAGRSPRGGRAPPRGGRRLGGGPRPDRARARRVRRRHALPEAHRRDDGPAHRYRGPTARGRRRRAPGGARDRARPPVADDGIRAGRVRVDRRDELHRRGRVAVRAAAPRHGRGRERAALPRAAGHRGARRARARAAARTVDGRRHGDHPRRGRARQPVGPSSGPRRRRQRGHLRVRQGEDRVGSRSAS